MALRIDEQVIRGEIDNSERGRVVGRLWLVGREEPLELNLTGDCWRDLAGRRLEFTNPEPKGLDREGLTTEQKGTVGDITASRKVKVPEIPMEEIGEYYAAKKPFPWHWGNSLYLEWFSQSNGRVVIETVSYDLKIVGEPAWEMTPEEETLQRGANEREIGGFMETLSKAAEASVRELGTRKSLPQTEEEADQMLARNDILTDRIHARLDRDGIEADFEGIINEELARLGEETGVVDTEWMSGESDWELNSEGDFVAGGFEMRDHPLAVRARDLTVQLIEANRESKWVPEGAMEEHPATYLVECVAKAGAKLSGALFGVDWPPKIDSCAGVIARLKRARVYLDDSLLALESCQEQELIEAAVMGVVLVEVIDIAKEADDIISELRVRLKDGY